MLTVVTNSSIYPNPRKVMRCAWMCILLQSVCSIPSAQSTIYGDWCIWCLCGRRFAVSLSDVMYGIKCGWIWVLFSWLLVSLVRCWRWASFEGERFAGSATLRLLSGYPFWAIYLVTIDGVIGIDPVESSWWYSFIVWFKLSGIRGRCCLRLTRYAWMPMMSMESSRSARGRSGITRSAEGRWSACSNKLLFQRLLSVLKAWLVLTDTVVTAI